MKKLIRDMDKGILIISIIVLVYTLIRIFKNDKNVFTF